MARCTSLPEVRQRLQQQPGVPDLELLLLRHLLSSLAAHPDVDVGNPEAPRQLPVALARELLQEGIHRLLLLPGFQGERSGAGQPHRVRVRGPPVVIGLEKGGEVLLSHLSGGGHPVRPIHQPWSLHAVNQPDPDRGQGRGTVLPIKGFVVLHPVGAEPGARIPLRLHHPVGQANHFQPVVLHG